MTEREIHSQIVRWCELVTGLNTIKSHSNKKRPSGEYLMVNFLTGPADVRQFVADIEYEDTGIPNSEGNNEINAIPVIESEWKFSISSYRGDDPMRPIRLLRSRSKIQGPQQGIDPLLNIHDMGIPNNVPELINNRWEKRAHVMIYVRAYTRDGFLIDVIDEVPVTYQRI